MNRPLLFCLATSIFICLFTNAQTWTGAENSDWNNAENWTPKTVPTLSGDVTIGAGASNWPALSGDVNTGALHMTAGSRLQLNGYILTAGGGNREVAINGAILNGGHLNISSSIPQIFDGNTVNGNLTITTAGTGVFREADKAPNVYNGNVTINLHGGLAGICVGSSSQFLGNLEVNRYAPGNTYIFHGGLARLDGDFRYFNLQGGSTYINQQSKSLTPISGRIDIDYAHEDPFPSEFIMKGLRNLEGGGKVKICALDRYNFPLYNFDMLQDTLVVDSIDIRDFVNADFTQNVITGNFFFQRSDEPTLVEPVIITDNILHGAGQIWLRGEAYRLNESRNTFHGDVYFLFEGIMSGGGISSDAPSAYRGNLRIESHKVSAGIFTSGFSALEGDFIYSGDVDNLEINSTLLPLPAIGGRIFIDLTGVPSPTFNGVFLMKGMKNNTPGGHISIWNRIVEIQQNDLNLDSCTMRNCFSYAYAHSFYRNRLSGDLLFTSSDVNEADFIFASSTIGGKTSVTMNNARGSLVEDSNTYHNDVEFILDHKAGPAGTVQPGYIGKLNPSAYFGNLSITRKGPADLYIFNRGLTALHGNFNYVNTAEKATYINPESYPTAFIGGKINISDTPPVGGAPFTMSRIKNKTTGGDILIQRSGQFKLLFDTLVVNSLVATGFKSPGGENGLAYSKIDGNLSLSDDATNKGPIYLYGNIITGNTEIKTNSTVNLFQGYFNADVFNGDVNIERNGTGNIQLAYLAPAYFNGNLHVNTGAGLIFTDTVNFGGNSQSSFEQLGTQPVIIPKLRLLKTVGITLALRDPVTVTNRLIFQSGIIDCTLSPLQFADNATHEGASNLSHATGRVIKTGNDPFTFPTGSLQTFNAVSMSAPANITDVFSAGYFQRNPSLDGMNTGLFQQTSPTPIKRVSNCEYWDVQRLNGSSNVSLSFSYGDIACPVTVANYINDPSKVRIVHWNGSLWEDLGNGAYTGTSNGTVTTAAPVTQFSPFTLASTDITLNPLPLTLLSFNAIKKEGKAELKWETVNELNVSHFEVQRSTNNIFQTIAKIPANNTTGKQVYRATDPAPAHGHNYYRLKSVDFDGNTSFSHTIGLAFDSNSVFQVWPNPVHRKSAVQVSLPVRAGAIQLRLLNNSGQLVKQWNRAGAPGAVALLDIGDQLPGLYVLQMVHGTEVQVVKLVVRE